jgi:hypothetical protein
MTSSIDDGLTVRAMGPATDAGRISLAELARIASTLQATLERIALSVAGGRPRAGRRPQEIADAVRLDFTGFRSGSAVLELDRAEPSAPGDLLSTSFEVLTLGVNEIRESGQIPRGELGRHFTRTVLNGLVEMCGGIGEDNLTAIEFSTNSNIIQFTLDRRTQTNLRAIRRATVEQDTIVIGRLHMGDFDPMSLRCRIDTNLGSIWCDFDTDLKSTVFENMDQLVSARGTAELHSDGVSIRVLHLVDISVLETSSTRSLDELAREQNVRPLEDVRQLEGEPIEDFELFLQAIRVARGEE